MEASKHRGILAASTSAFAGMSLEKALAGVAESGFDHVEIACLRGSIEHIAQEQMTQSMADELMTMLQELGLKSVALSAHMDLTGKCATKEFAQRMEFAKALSVQFVITNISPKESRRVFIANLKSLLPLAEDLGIMIGLESPGHVLTSRSEYEGLLQELDSPLVGLNLDIGNVFTASLGTVNPIEDLVYLMDHICHFHVKDAVLRGEVWRFTPLGDGELGYGEILSAITGEKRQIPVSIEMPLSLEGKGGAPAYLTPRKISYSEIVQKLRDSKLFAERHLYRSE